MRRLESKVSTAAISAQQARALVLKIGLTATMIGYAISTMVLMIVC